MAWAGPWRPLPPSWTRLARSASLAPSRRALSTQEDRIHASLSDYDEALSSSPWARLLASPLRRCIITKQIMPKAMMVQLKTAFFPAATTEEKQGDSTGADNQQQAPPSSSGPAPRQLLDEFFVPDGVLHPKFQHPRHGRSASLCASKLCFDAISSSTHKAGILKRLSSSAKVPPKLSDMVAHQLRQRVEQELELLQRSRAKARKEAERQGQQPAAVESALKRRQFEEAACCYVELEASSSTAGKEDTAASPTIEEPDAALPSSPSWSLPTYCLARLYPDEAQRLRVRDALLEVSAPYRKDGEDSGAAEQLRVFTIPDRAPELVPLVMALWRLDFFERGSIAAKGEKAGQP